jgi:predicted dehydrogenase
VDRNRDRALEVAREVGAEVVESVQELARQVDAAVVAAPTAVHEELACLLLEHGVHVLVEKPLALDVSGARAIVEAAKRCRRTLAVGHVEIFNPVVEAVFREGVVPRYIEAHRLGGFSGRGLDMDVVLDLMVHDLHLSLKMAQSSVREIRALGIPVLTEGLDLVQARIEFENGIVSNLTASRASLEKMRRLRLFSDRTYYSLDLASQSGRRVWVAEKEGRKEIKSEELAVTPEEPLRAELEAFLAACRGEATPRVPGEEGLAAVELALSVRQEARRGMERCLTGPIPEG